jgi:hypothetical protein
MGNGENDDQQADVYALLRQSVESRVRLAKSMLAAYRANAFQEPATPEDLDFWTQELADARLELAGFHPAHEA